jgi:hypothetical protein
MFTQGCSVTSLHATLTQAMLLHFVRRLLKARGHEFVEQLVVSSVPHRDWLISFNIVLPRPSDDPDGKRREELLKDLKRCFRPWAVSAQRLSQEDQKASGQNYTMPNATFSSLINFISSCAEDKTRAVSFGGGSEAWLNRQWLVGHSGHRHRLLRLMQLIRKLHDVNEAAHAAQHPINKMREAIENDFLNPLAKIFDGTAPNRVMY